MDTCILFYKSNFFRHPISYFILIVVLFKPSFWHPVFYSIEDIGTLSYLPSFGHPVFYSIEDIGTLRYLPSFGHPVFYSIEGLPAEIIL